MAFNQFKVHPFKVTVSNVNLHPYSAVSVAPKNHVERFSEGVDELQSFSSNRSSEPNLSALKNRLNRLEVETDGTPIPNHSSDSGSSPRMLSKFKAAVGTVHQVDNTSGIQVDPAC